MILPEDSGVAYEKVCDELGYDAIGVPETEDDVEAFKQYRDSKQLGSLIVASVPRDLFNQHEVSLAHFARQDLLQTPFALVAQRHAALKRRYRKTVGKRDQVVAANIGIREMLVRCERRR